MNKINEKVMTKVTKQQNQDYTSDKKDGPKALQMQNVSRQCIRLPLLGTDIIIFMFQSKYIDMKTTIFRAQMQSWTTSLG